MTEADHTPRTRRQFLRYLAGSPLLASLEAWGGEASAGQAGASNLAGPARFTGNGVIGSPDEAISVFDFEAAAERLLPPAHYGYLATGVDDDGTVRANREAFSKIQIRPRRLIDVRQIDMSVEVLGAKMETPIIVAPVGSQRAFHAEGELPVARAARRRNHLQILSTVTTTSVEEVVRERGEPVWYQLYPTSEWRITEALVARAEAAGCPVLVLTVDLNAGSNRETLKRFRLKDERDCGVCHGEGFQEYMSRKPMFDGLDLSGLEGLNAPGLDWSFVRRLKDSTRMRLVLKGIVTQEDARIAVDQGVDGIIVSNHGGRAEESGRGTLESLPEVIAAVAGRIPVLIDGGFRRGTDIFKALALGARAICVGRPYLWGLAAFGQQGVEAVLDILRRELELVMKQAGTVSLAQITSEHVT